MAALSSAFSPVYQTAGSVDAVCCCLPPRALAARTLRTTGSWLGRFFRTLVPKRSAASTAIHAAAKEVFLAVANGELISLCFGEAGDVLAHEIIPLDSIKNVQVTQHSDWEHEILFTHDSQPYRFVTCAYVFGSLAGTPPELVERLQFMESDVVNAIKTRL